MNVLPALSPRETAAALERPLHVAAYAALALAAHVVESFVVLPVPYLRVGFANVFVLGALWAEGPAAALAVAVTKTVGTALALGTLFSPVFGLNAGGTLVAWAAMSAVAWAARRREGAVIPASALGGVAHGLWQTLYVGWWAGGAAAAPLAAFLVPWGLGTGVAVGVAAASFRRRTRAEAHYHV